MAVLGPDDVFDDDIYHAITHVNGAPPEGGCELARTWTAEMAQKNWDEAIRVGQGTLDADTSSADQDLNNPTGGLYAHAAVFNPTDGTYFTYAADALIGWADGVLWFPQNSTGVEALWPYTTDQGLAWDEGEDDNGFVEYFDLPDLSTPALNSSTYTGTFTATVAYVNGSGANADLTTTTQSFPGSLSTNLVVTHSTLADVTLAIGSEAAAAKRDAVTSALLKHALANDYITGGAYESEWLVTFTSRYLHVNVEGGVDINGDDLPLFAAASDPFTEYERAETGEACEVIDFAYWDREEGAPSDPGSIDFSPGGSVPDVFQLCYEVNVMAFNQDAGANSSVLRSATVAKYVGLEPGYDNGWAALEFNDFEIDNWNGLPGTGFMTVADTSGDVARGATFRHHQSNAVGSGRVTVEDPRVTFQAGYYWVRADYGAPRADHGAVCGEFGLVATPYDVPVTWDATLLGILSADFGYSSIGDYNNSAHSMWCWDGDGGPSGASAGDCGTHNFGSPYENYGSYSSDPDIRPVFTCTAAP